MGCIHRRRFSQVTYETRRGSSWRDWRRIKRMPGRTMTTTTTTTTSTTTRRLLHRRVNEFPGITARRPPHEVHGEMRQQPLHTVRYTVTLLVVSSSTRNLPLFFLILHCPPVLWANYSRTFVRIACIGSLDPKKKNIFTLSTFACSPHRFSPRGRTTQLSKASFTACGINYY